LAVASTAIAFACPNCKDALANDPAQAGLVRGFFWSIMFMVSMPFLIFGGVSLYFYWEVQRAKQARSTALADDSAAVAVDSPFAEESVRVEEADPVGAC
jgi:heme/copper-type cytochrome/quinol oxidase subunit 2